MSKSYIADSDRYWDKVYGTEGPRTVSEWDVEDYAEEEGISLEEARAILTPAHENWIDGIGVIQCTCPIGHDHRD